MSLHRAKGSRDDLSTGPLLREQTSFNSFTSIFASRKLSRVILSNNRPPSVSSQSSGWSRALVGWFPKAVYINNDSTNTSTSTIVQYPVRDPGRLQKLKGSPNDELYDNHHVHNNTALDNGSSQQRDTTAASDVTLLDDDIGLIRAFVVDNARFWDGYFDLTVSIISRLYIIWGHRLGIKRISVQEQLEQEVRLELRQLDKHSGNLISFLIWTWILSLSTTQEHNTILRSTFTDLCDPQPQPEVSFFRRWTDVIAVQPDQMVKISEHLLKCILDSFTGCLKPGSTTLAYAKALCAHFLTELQHEIGFVAAIFATLDIAQLKGLVRASPNNTWWLLIYAGYVAYNLGHYRTAQDLFTIKLGIHNTSPLMKDFYFTYYVSGCHYNLAWCLYRQNQHQEALQHAQEALAFCSGYDEQALGYIEDIQHLIDDIEVALKKEAKKSVSPLSRITQYATTTPTNGP
ncbi:hypothetical protein H2198_008888 [Neophaeococcomyces mojaviensis]|uniref:Uncharacterized protein n=1 Tax=Neophaeococcomyces mojaviensis TaxID=3383035 RepID=A0ACC2ZW11_9EURO|nr:hypothetical protein H2198_008888 [Knufia sp. JES_112]